MIWFAHTARNGSHAHVAGDRHVAATEKIGAIPEKATDLDDTGNNEYRRKSDDILGCRNFHVHPRVVVVSGFLQVCNGKKGPLHVRW